MKSADRWYALASVLMLLAASLVLRKPELVKPSRSYRELKPLRQATVHQLITRSAGSVSLDTLALDDGIDRLIYVMSTTCRYCESQRSTLEREFSRIDSMHLVTLSMENAEDIRGYWRKGFVGPPKQLISISGVAIRQVPTALCVSGTGRVKRAIVGIFAESVFGAIWSEAKSACA